MLFSFFVIFIQLCDSRKIHYLNREFREIALIFLYNILYFIYIYIYIFRNISIPDCIISLACFVVQRM